MLQSEYISEEMGTKLGNKVGYAIRLRDVTGVGSRGRSRITISRGHTHNFTLYIFFGLGNLYKYQNLLLRKFQK